MSWRGGAVPKSDRGQRAAHRRAAALGAPAWLRPPRPGPHAPEGSKARGALLRSAPNVTRSPAPSAASDMQRLRFSPTVGRKLASQRGFAVILERSTCGTRWSAFRWRIRRALAGSFDFSGLQLGHPRHGRHGRVLASLLAHLGLALDYDRVRVPGPSGKSVQVYGNYRVELSSLRRALGYGARWLEGQIDRVQPGAVVPMDPEALDLVFEITTAHTEAASC